MSADALFSYGALSDVSQFSSPRKAHKNYALWPHPNVCDPAHQHGIEAREIGNSLLIAQFPIMSTIGGRPEACGLAWHCHL